MVRVWPVPNVYSSQVSPGKSMQDPAEPASAGGPSTRPSWQIRERLFRNGGGGGGQSSTLMRQSVHLVYLRSRCVSSSRQK